MKKSLFIVLALVLALSAVLVGCGGKKEENGAQTGGNSGTSSTPAGNSDSVSSNVPQVLKLNNNSEPGYLQPGLARGTHDSWVLEHVMEGLTKKGVDGAVEPGIAASWDISEDGLTYTFHLRDAKWSNGDAVTAHDFEYEWKWVLDPANASEYAYQIADYIKGAEAYNSGTGSIDDVAIKALDEKTLEVTLAAPTGYFLDLLNFYTYYPVNQKVQEANPDWYKEAATYVSNGAFKLAEWSHKESIVLKKNENYYNAEAIKLEEVQMAIVEEASTAWQMFQSDDLDLVYPLPTDVIPVLAAQDAPEFVIGTELGTYYYNVNTTLKPFTNAKIRKALSMAIDREAIVEHVSQGGEIPATGLTPPGIPDVSGDYNANQGNLIEYNPEAAKALLAEGLAEEGLSKLSFTLLYNVSEAHKKIAEAVQEMWKKHLDVDITLEVVEFQIKLDREVALDYQVSRAGWLGDYVDPMTFVDMFVTGGGNNNTGWGNAEYDRLVKEAKATADNDIRMPNMHKAEKLLMDEMPIIPVYFYSKPYALNTKVKGIYQPINRYPQFHYAYIE